MSLFFLFWTLDIFVINLRAFVNPRWLNSMQSFKKMLGKTLRKAFYRHRCIRTERLMVTISRKDRDTLMTSFTSTGVKWEKITLRKGNAILFDKCSIYWYALTYSQNFDLHIDLRPYVNSISAARGVGECPTPWFFYMSS